MRIIAGTHRGRRLTGPPDDRITRPITDKVKESVFNILRGHVEDQDVVDVFAGTGSLGLEAVSRGARSVLCVEQNRQIVSLLRENIASLGEEDRCRVLQSDALGAAALAQCPEPVHLVFFDPPYPLMTDPVRRARVLEQLGRFIERLDPDGYALLRAPSPMWDEESTSESGDKREVPLAIPGALGPETHRYGSMSVHLYMRDDDFSKM
ncbi:MAG: 16S rRNA (guanine(966)-N(2))-methyltransferase RsmD [Planctomycetota bacterium]|jgi:16S rRNA (guanine966-N2)-methyltransferase